MQVIHLIISFAPLLVLLSLFFFFCYCFSGDLRKVIRPVNTSRNYQLPYGAPGGEGFNHVFTDGPRLPVRRFYRHPPGGRGVGTLKKRNTPRKYCITNGRWRTAPVTVNLTEWRRTLPAERPNRTSWIGRFVRPVTSKPDGVRLWQTFGGRQNWTISSRKRR